MNETDVELLHKSFDAELSGEESNQLEVALQSSEELRAHQDELKKMRDMFAASKHSFSDDFSKKVVSEISKAKTGILINGDFTNEMVRQFRRIAIPAAAAVALVLLYDYFVMGSTSLDAMLGLEVNSSEDLFTLLSYNIN